MGARVTLQNPRTGEIKVVKVGWNWTLFLLSDFFGLPLFLRGLNGWGLAFLALWAADAVLSDLVAPPDLGMAEMVLYAIGAGMHLWLGLKGNEMTAKRCLERGWVFADRDGDATRLARLRWGVSPAMDEEPAWTA
jgi:hypothetical protein